MKIINRILLSLVVLFSFSTPLVAAQSLNNQICTDETSDSTFCKENQDKANQEPGNNSLYGPNGLITKVVRIISIVIGIAAVIMIMVGGVRYITSSGDPNNTTGAKNTILYAIVGLLVALLAQAIIIFVINKL